LLLRAHAPLIARAAFSFQQREVVGGPQNATPTGGFADRERFGRFHVTAVAEPSAIICQWHTASHNHERSARVGRSVPRSADG
jgi:hypothetical protein